jgi:Delta3-Delta2-enoyl-CoA isomerase
MTSLFKVPISTGGLFECTTVSENVYLISFTSPPDNRVTRAFLSAFLLALDILERRYPKGVLITTSAISKFYSNGFDLNDLAENPRFYEDYLFPVLRRLLT